jgi:hypothetical protein
VSTGIRCLSCNDVLSPADCKTVTLCSEDSVSFISGVIRRVWRYQWNNQKLFHLTVGHCVVYPFVILLLAIVLSVLLSSYCWPLCCLSFCHLIVGHCVVCSCCSSFLVLSNIHSLIQSINSKRWLKCHVLLYYSVYRYTVFEL